MRKADSGDGWILFGVGAAFAAFVAFKFSGYFSLSRGVGGSVFAWTAVLIVTVRFSWSVGGDFPWLRLRNIWPILLALLWVSWWPAVDFWAGESLVPSLDHASALPWWATRLAKWGGVAGIVTLGYLGGKRF